jgi:ABC-type Zn uptake system ZnuABC Zn-binding protein ZnuA
MHRSIIVLVSIILLASACSPLASQPNPKTGPIVLASTTFLADMARNVAGDRVQVDSLLPTGADPHGYQPTPSDVAKISKSTVLIVNGLGYEQFLSTLLQNAGGKRDVIEATAGISPRKNAGLENGVDPHMSSPMLKISAMRLLKQTRTARGFIRKMQMHILPN